MWVLDAWQDAEKVWFPIVWEEKKDPSNVVDYDIRDEITIDTSSVFNANNNTTTGMANVIPWVNAPKLIESTSIYRDVKETWLFGADLYWEVSLWTLTPQYPENDAYSLNMTVSNERWGYKIKYYNWWINNRGMRIPEEWWYEITATYPRQYWTYYFEYDYVRIPNYVSFHNYNCYWTSSATTESFKIKFNKWDLIWVKFTGHYTWSSSLALDDSLTFHISKIA